MMKTHKPKKHRVLRALCVVLTVLMFLTGVELVHSNYSLTVSRYTVCSEKLTDTVRVLFLADLHGRTFGRDNSRLLNKIAMQKPDLIALAGDVFNNDADADEIDAMCALLRQCTQIAPVYFSLGNQEASFIKVHGSDLLDRIKETGAALVDNHYLDLSVNGNPLRIGGYMGYFGQANMTTKDPEQIKLEQNFCVDFKNTERFKLLLNHIPTGWLDWEYIDNDSVDLVLCGHYHGGVVRIPFLGQGLFAPNVGWFPPYTKGLFVGEKATCILTTGLAGSYGIPRFFNTPEICLVVLSPEQSKSGPASSE